MINHFAITMFVQYVHNQIIVLILQVKMYAKQAMAVLIVKQIVNAYQIHLRFAVPHLISVKHATNLKIVTIELINNAMQVLVVSNVPLIVTVYHMINQDV